MFPPHFTQAMTVVASQPDIQTDRGCEGLPGLKQLLTVNTAGLSQRSESKTDSADRRPLFFRNRGRRAHTAYRQGRELSGCAHPASVSRNLTFLPRPGRTSKKQTPQWATREPPENQTCREQPTGSAVCY